MAKGKSNEYKDANSDAASIASVDTYTPLLEHTRSEASPPQRWNSPRVNTFRLGAAFWGFIINGAQDASLGPLIPYLARYYELDYITVSLLFLPPFCGYVVSAFASDALHVRYGRRAVAVIAPVTRFTTYAVFALHPPYAVLVMVLMIAGFGSGLQDGSWNAWVGTMAQATPLLGCLHGCYAAGAMLAPLAITYMVDKLGLQWYRYYYFMMAAEVVELCTAVPAFWKQTGKVFAAKRHILHKEAEKSSMHEVLLMAPAAKITWLSATFMFGAVGVEVVLGGWITTFMLEVRHATPFASGMCAMGFWLGFTTGRFTLGFLSYRIGERRAVCIYLPLITGLLLAFWLVPEFWVSVVTITLSGVLLAPIFPVAIVAMAKLLPDHLHISGISFAATVGKCGGALLPFGVGAIAQARGVETLQPIVVTLTVVLLFFWLMLPRM